MFKKKKVLKTCWNFSGLLFLYPLLFWKALTQLTHAGKLFLSLGFLFAFKMRRHHTSLSPVWCYHEVPFLPQVQHSQHHLACRAFHRAGSLSARTVPSSQPSTKQIHFPANPWVFSNKPVTSSYGNQRSLPPSCYYKAFPPGPLLVLFLIATPVWLYMVRSIILPQIVSICDYNCYFVFPMFCVVHLTILYHLEWWILPSPTRWIGRS